MANQMKFREKNQELKLNGEELLKLSTLESLRKTWFELGYDAGHRDGKAGKKKHYKEVDKAYDEVRGQHGESR